MLKGFATINYHAADLGAAGAWYTEVLGMPPYFEVPGGYKEFRVGDYRDELGLVDASYGLKPTDEPAGQAMFWHVEDLDASLERLLSLGATLHQPRIERGHGFATASVIDPFGNVLGIMYNPHYVAVRERLQPGAAKLDELAD